MLHFLLPLRGSLEEIRFAKMTRTSFPSLRQEVGERTGANTGKGENAIPALSSEPDCVLKAADPKRHGKITGEMGGEIRKEEKG